MSVYRRILMENRVVPSSAKKGREEQINVPSRVKEKSGFDTIDNFPDITDDEGNYSEKVPGRSRTEINREAAVGDFGMPTVKQESHSATELVDVLEDMSADELDLFISESWKSASRSRAACISLRKRAVDLRESLKSEATPPGYKPGKVKLGDGTFFEIDDLQAHALNKLMKSTPRPESLDKVARKNSTEFTSILQFAKSLDESEDLNEVSKERLDRYVSRATTEFDLANMGRRHTAEQPGKEEESKYWARKEKNRRRGISRAIDQLDRKGE